MTIFFTEIIVDAMAGCRLQQAVEEAAEIARTLRREVVLRFNDAEAPVGPLESVSVVKERWGMQYEKNCRLAQERKLLDVTGC